MANRRITYNSKNIDIEVEPQDITVEYRQIRNVNMAGSGKTEIINLNGITEITAPSFFDEDTYRDLVGWWSWARQGKSFSFAMSTADNTNTTVSTGSTAGQTIVYLSSKGDISTGNSYLVRAEDNDDEFEVVTVSAMTTAGTTGPVQVTADANLVFSYSSGDTFRFHRYWPSLVCLNDNFNVTKAPGADIYYYTFHFREDL